jgi:DNA-binding transcriptional LysR family regulator
LVEARRLLVQLDEAVRTVRRVGRGEVGRLTVGFVPSASNATLPACLRAFRQRYPDVEVYLREMAPDDLVRTVTAGSVDVGFLYLPFADEALEVAVVSREPLIAALPADHRLSARAQIRVAELAPEPFVLPAQHRMPGLLAQVIDTCRRAGFEPVAVQKDVWLMQTIVGLVAAGLGVALVPASVENLHRSGVVYRSLRGAASTVQLGAIWRREPTAPPPLASFLGVVGELTREGSPQARR